MSAITSFSDLDLNQLYSYADYYKWKFEERVELIRGKIFAMSPAPNRYHQKISGNLNFQLRLFLSGKKCEVYYAPFDVRLPTKSNEDKDIYTVLQPDLCVICDPSKLLDNRGCVGAPDIVVEILSPSNSKKEMRYKYEVYEESGVREYWVLFPQQRLMYIYALLNNKFVPSKPWVIGDNVTSEVLPGFSMNLSDIFDEEE